MANHEVNRDVEAGASEGDRRLVREFLGVAKGSQKDQGKLVGVSQTTIARWLKGDIRPLSASVRERLRAYVGRSLAGPGSARAVVSRLRITLDEIEAELEVIEGRGADGDDEPPAPEIDRLG